MRKTVKKIGPCNCLYTSVSDSQIFSVAVTTQTNRTTGTSAGVPLAIRSLAETSIARSQRYLLQEQKEEGYWVGELIVDVTLVADMVAYHYWNGSIDANWQRKAVNHIFSRQLPDGGWNISSNYYAVTTNLKVNLK